MMPSFVVLHPLQLPAGAGSLRATHQQRYYLEQQIIARLSILILSKTYPLVITTSPTLDMIGFLSTGFLLLKSNKEYVLTFKILAQVLVELFLSMVAIYCKHKLCNTIDQAHYSSTSIIRDLMASGVISCAIQLIKHYSSTSIIRDLMASGVSSLR
jgi:hypothetical protein